jgi:arylsulfatase A-like enzyme
VLAAELPGLGPGDWDAVVVRARATGGVRTMGLRFNRSGDPAVEGIWEVRADEVRILDDDAVHSYRLRTEIKVGRATGSWRQLGLVIESAAAAHVSVELVSVTLVPRVARYASSPTGVGLEGRQGTFYRSIYQRAPGTLSFRVRVPAGGRLDLGLGVALPGLPVDFRVEVESAAGRASTVLAESSEDHTAWIQRSVSLGQWAGETVDIRLGCSSEPPGAVALWAAPTISGSGVEERPNVILYVIDGLGADYMSAYGYPVSTTPNLDRLASEGVLFERAFSNSSWTKPSTVSLMTSLHHGVLGGFSTFADAIPRRAVTLAERLHGSGYLTAVFVSNPFAGRVSSLSRGADIVQDTRTGNNSVSSAALHEQFWRWRELSPGRPFWVHFQTTDVHSPYRPPDPDRFVTSADVDRFSRWSRQLVAAGGTGPGSPAWAATGIDREAYLETQRHLYEECLAHNDRRIGELVAALETAGEWRNTLLIVTADHGARAAGFQHPDPMPAYRVLANGHETRIPLIIVWPGTAARGLRITDPVSLIDVLPTVLEIAGLGEPEIFQGRSLVPLLRGTPGVSREPVVLEELQVDPETRELRGLVELIDGNWAASLQIGSGLDPAPGGAVGERPAELLLFDLSTDPFCRRSLHRSRPDLVERYRDMLSEIRQRHLELGESFAESPSSELTREQLDALRELGYVQ